MNDQEVFSVNLENTFEVNLTKEEFHLSLYYTAIEPHLTSAHFTLKLNLAYKILNILNKTKKKDLLKDLTESSKTRLFKGHTSPTKFFRFLDTLSEHGIHKYFLLDKFDFTLQSGYSSLVPSINIQLSQNLYDIFLKTQHERQNQIVINYENDQYHFTPILETKTCNFNLENLIITLKAAIALDKAYTADFRITKLSDTIGIQNYQTLTKFLKNDIIQIENLFKIMAYYNEIDYKQVFTQNTFLGETVLLYYQKQVFVNASDISSGQKLIHNNKTYAVYYTTTQQITI